VSLFSFFRQSERPQTNQFPAGSAPRPAGNSLASTLSSTSLEDQLLRHGRYCILLISHEHTSLEPGVLASCWKSLEREMALVPNGSIWLADPLPVEEATPVEQGQTVPVASFFLDRHTVTNAQFAHFVASGGYNQEELWPVEIVAQLLDFVDQSGRPGPRSWSGGAPPRNKLEHPVVGITWYEANAYARWAGKRLPTPAEWQRAGSWATNHGRSEPKYPWGNAFDPKCANTWLSGLGTTVPVHEYSPGATRNGIYQLIGNVWEWVDAVFDGGGSEASTQVAFEQPLGEVRGGAFDTYFETQATCRFRTGQPLLERRSNVGFRCCVSLDQLPASPDPSALVEAPT
jgi:iron(II)-dependent oxidoreductase